MPDAKCQVPTTSGTLVVISGPSGVGKTVIVREVLRRTGALYSVSVTTRQPRPGEVDGRDYRFLDVPAFERLREAGELLEWALVHGNYYGTPAGPVRQALAAGRTMILEIDVQGALQVHGRMPGGTYVLIVSPSDEELRRRLVGRKTEPPEVIERRFARAKAEIEMARASGFYTHIVVNDELPAAVERVVKLIEDVARP